MNHSCYIIFISLILDLLAFTIILPLMPSILDYYESNDKVSILFDFQHFQYYRKLLVTNVCLPFSRVAFTCILMISLRHLEYIVVLLMI